MNPTSRPISRLSWAKWLLLNTLAWAVAAETLYGFVWWALFIGAVTTAAGFRPSPSTGKIISAVLVSIAGAVVGALTGVFMAIMQRLALRRQLVLSRRWEIAHSAGVAAGGIVMWLTSFSISAELLLPHNYSQNEALYLIGLSLAWVATVTVQWLVLRQESSPPTTWVFLSAVNLAVGGLTAGIVYRFLLFELWLQTEINPAPVTILLRLAVVCALGGTVGGVVSGVSVPALRALLKRIRRDTIGTALGIAAIVVAIVILVNVSRPLAFPALSETVPLPPQASNVAARDQAGLPFCEHQTKFLVPMTMRQVIRFYDHEFSRQGWLHYDICGLVTTDSGLDTAYICGILQPRPRCVYILTNAGCWDQCDTLPTRVEVCEYALETPPPVLPLLLPVVPAALLMIGGSVLLVGSIHRARRVD